MGYKITGLMTQLGWRRFFQLVWNLPSFGRLFIRLIKDERVAAGPKLLVAAVLAYVILPVDLIPDVFLGPGQLDDVAVVLGGLKLFLGLCPPEVVKEHLQAISKRR